MSYILFASTGTAVTYPISVVNGGTGASDPFQAVTNLSSPAFATSSSSSDWGIIPVPAVAAPDVGALEVSVNELLNGLQALGIIQVI